MTSINLPGKGTWDKPETDVMTGQKPEARMGHTAVYDPTMRCIYVYGGSKNIKWFSDVHVLELDNMKWQLVKVRFTLVYLFFLLFYNTKD